MDLAYRTPEDLAEATGDYEAIRHPETPYGRECRRRDAIQAVKERYWKLHQRLGWRMKDEIKRVEREFRR